MKEYLIPLNKTNIKINVLEGSDISDPKAIILNIHGIGAHFQPVYPSLDEFKNRDDYFNKFGYKSFAFEFRGHGKSDGIRCSINNFNDLVDDLIAVISHIRSLHKDITIFLCAESMGGAVVFKYIIDSYSISDAFIGGIILYSPLCGIDDQFKPPPIVIELLLRTSYILPQTQLALTTSDMSLLTSRNQSYKDVKKKCKFTFKGPHRLCTVRELYNICLWIPENVQKITTPILIFHGLQDKITVPGETIKVYEKISSNNKKLVLLPESEHVLLIPNTPEDLTPDFIYTQMHSWIDSCVSTQSSVQEPDVEEADVEEAVDTEDPVATEEPDVEEPVDTEEPVAIEEPVDAEEPVAIEEPVDAEEPVATEESDAEEPVAEKPAIDQPVVDQPVVEEPVVDQSVAEEPVAEEPAIDQPVVEEPAIEESAIEEPVVEESAIEESAIEESVAEESDAEEHVAIEHVAEESDAESTVKHTAGFIIVQQPDHEEFTTIDQPSTETVINQPSTETVIKKTKSNKTKTKSKKIKNNDNHDINHIRSDKFI